MSAQKASSRIHDWDLEVDIKNEDPSGSFLDVFLQKSPIQRWQKLEIVEKFIEFSAKFLKFYVKYILSFSENSLNLSKNER